MADDGMLSRRAFLHAGAAAMAVAGVARPALAEAEREAQALTFGVFADPHYADREPLGTRHYRDSDEKLGEFVKAMGEAKPDFAICLGDFVDKGKTIAEELAYLKHIDAVYRKLDCPRHYALGNHDLATLTKAQFLKATGMPAPHYAFDAPPFRCVVLDACYRKDFEPYSKGNFVWTDSWVPPDELRWLEAELKRAEGKALVFVHQPLDGDDVHCVRNAADVRRSLEESGKVVAVFSGHNHKGGYRRVRGIHYVTLCGLVEGPGLEHNAYALVTVTPAGSLTLKGFGVQPSSTRE